MIVKFSDEAKGDLAAIAEYIAEDDQTRALSFVEELEQACMSLADFPHRFPLLAGYERRGIRRRVYGQYLIVYQVIDHDVQVLRVVHGRRDYEAMLSAD